MLQPGDKAPDFTATATNGNVIALHDYLGRNNVILYFYPQDDTSGCTREACDFRDAKVDFDGVNAAILGVSSDTEESHKAFSDKYSLNFPLLVDADGTICDLYGVPRHDTYPARVTFLIDTDGIIRHVWEKVSVIGHATDVREKVAALS
jgi:peroxiredoxin Q/BCP